MNRTRRLLPLGMLSVGAMVLAGCTATPGGAPEGGITLRMTIFDDGLMSTFEEIADEYMEANPEVTDIKFENLPFDSYNTAVTTQLASGNGPDMAWMLESDAPTYLNANALYDLAPAFQDAPDYDFDDLSKAATKLWSDGDSLYAYPFSTSTFGLLYNKDLLTAAGLPGPDEMIADGSWTWENLAKNAGAVTDATSQTGFSISAFDYKRWDNLSLIWRSFGAQPWSEDGATCTFDSPEMVKAFEFIHDATFAQGGFLQPGTLADFSAGQSAYFASTVSYVRSLEDSTFEWGLAPLPAGPEGVKPIFGQAAMGVFSSSKHPEAAAGFLAYLTNPDNARKLAAAYPPPRESLLNVEVLSGVLPMLSPEQIQDVVIAGVTTGEVKPNHDGFDEILSTVRAALDPMWEQGADVAKVLDGVCQKLQPLLAE